MKMLYKFLSLILFMPILAWSGNALAQETTEEHGEEISTILTPANKNAIFEDKAKYTFEVFNPTNTEQVGKVSYELLNQEGKRLRYDSVAVKIGTHSQGKYNFEIPADGVGFYRVNFMVNISEYDDTTRRVFGIKPEKIASPYKKPADFDSFWAKVKSELAQVSPRFRVTAHPEKDKDNRHVYLIEMQSLDNMTIRGWMTVPISSKKNRKFSVLLGLPGYQVNLQPLMGQEDDLAIITLNVRGQGNSRGPINTRRDEFIFHHIEDRNRYVMKGVVADCLRAIDFIASRDDLKADQILVSGGSMGGYLAIATASLDKRVKLCSAQNPILCDVRNLLHVEEWPMTSIKKYIGTQPGLTLEKVLSELDYFDAKNFADNVTCPTIMGIGLLDPFAPPFNEYATYNSIKGHKRIMVFKDLGHEINQAYKELEGRWMRDEFALF